MKYIPKVGDFFFASQYSGLNNYTSNRHANELLRASGQDGDFINIVGSDWPLDTNCREFVCANHFPEAQAILEKERVEAEKKAAVDRQRQLDEAVDRSRGIWPSGIGKTIYDNRSRINAGVCVSEQKATKKATESVLGVEFAYMPDGTLVQRDRASGLLVRV